jgi:hypothetical protein
VFRVALPPAALELLPTDFEVWTSSHYWQAITDYGLYEPTERQQMSAALGDFNGDGTLDLVVDGWSGDEALRLALVSDGPSYVLDDILRRPLSPGELETTEATEFLSLAEPGRYVQSFTDVPNEVELATAGYVVSFFEKGATLYYLRNGNWRELVVSD